MRRWTVFLSFIVGFLSFTSQAAPYSTSWEEIAKRSLSTSEMNLVRYILQDANWWQETRRDYDGSRDPKRHIEGNRTGLELLEDVGSDAAQGDEQGQRFIQVLLQISSSQRPLQGFKRELQSGTHVIFPSGYIGGPLSREAVADALEENQEDLSTLFKFLGEVALKDLNNVALSESVTALLAKPSLLKRAKGTSEFLKNFFLTMSLHPDPQVRISGLFGLSSFSVDDPFVHDFLIEQSDETIEIMFRAPRWERMQEVLARLPENSIFNSWRSALSKVYKEWLSKPFEGKLNDLGDLNWERMAQGAAAQALILPAGGLERQLIMTFDSHSETLEEKLEIRETLPRVDGFNSGNGTGFRVNKSYALEDHTMRRYSVSPFGITVQFSPRNAWILMGMDNYKLGTLFEAALEAPIEVRYGQLESVISWLKYDLLQLPPSANYFQQESQFKSRLSKKYADYQKEQEKLFRGAKILSLSQIEQALKDCCAVDNPKVVKLKPTTSTPKVNPEPPRQAGEPNIFSARLETLFAARALAFLEERETALGVLFSLLPSQWELSEADQQQLLQQVGTLRLSKEAQSMQVSEKSKLELLRALLKSFDLVLPKPDVQRLLIKWLASIKDPELAQHARQIFSAMSCESKLEP